MGVTGLSLPSAIVLDRDGVLNELWRHPDLGLVDSPMRPDQVVLKEGAAEAVRHINDAGIPCAVVSNQPGVAKGKMTLDLLHDVTVALLDQLRSYHAHVDKIYYCVHHPDAVVQALRRPACGNRKPQPGLLVTAFKDLGADAGDAWFIGDTSIDVEAGRRAGCRTAWIGTRRCDNCALNERGPDITAKSLLETVNLILRVP
jgi:D-glycero-D-manno-heptose 1,7-bisphosphate phosphatase